MFAAWKFLKTKDVNPAKVFREGGEREVMRLAQKYKFTLKKVKLPF